jgi:hypothetical protein
LFVAVYESGCGTKLPKLAGQSMSALPGNSDIDLFRYGQGVINLDAEVSGGAFDLGVAEQELHRPQVTSAPGISKASTSIGVPKRQLV